MRNLDFIARPILVKGFSFTVLLLFLFSSCGKKWKETTRANFDFSINKIPTNSGHASFFSGNMRLTQVQFSGTRKRGDAVNFTSTNSALLDFTTGTSNPPIAFDIPQGTYSDIEMQFRADPLDSANGSITLVGKFAHGPNDTVPIYFAFNPAQVFSVQAEDANGNHEITLVKDKPISVQVTFDPNYWFGAVSFGQFQAANHTTINSVPSIVVDAVNNSGIYQSVINRMGQSTKVIFQ